MKKSTRTQVYSKRHEGVFWYEPFPKSRGRTFYIAYMEQGHRVREKIGSEREHVTEKMAGQVREQRRVKERLGEEIPSGRRSITLDEAFSLYLEWAKENKKTWENDDRLYRKRIRPRFGNLPLTRIRPHDLELFRSKLKNTIGIKGTLLRPATVKHYMILIRRIINFAIQVGKYNGENPFRHIKFKQLNNKITEVLSKQQSECLLKVLDAYPDQATANLIRFAYYTGLRKGELFSLKWQDVIEEQRIVHIRSPKSGVDEVCYPNDIAWSILEEQRELVTDSAFVFPGKNGHMRVEIKTAWSTIKKRAELPSEFRFHGLRHNFASTLARNPNVSVFQLQALMRHRDIKTTQRYIDIAREDLRDAANLFFFDNSK